ncbi:uncharacterized protein LOC143919231 [Arctopsyche grandis]|uniref:uncharacterized protein LOC143919231 n=1 Tax=Arctopsyche grandis TaxID=121162 RepID=UPI00406D8A3D
MAVISQVATITGLGGIGKTELARKYALHYSNNYTHKIFITVENKESAAKSFKELAKQLGIELFERSSEESETKRTKEREFKAIVNEIFNRITENGDTTLLILDNAENFEDVKNFIPQRGPPSFKSIFTLITSRYIDWNVGQEGKIIVVSLNKFTHREALEYGKNELKEAETVGLEILVKTLDYSPLALKQAVGYIKQQNDTPKKNNQIFTESNYVKAFENESKVLLGKGLNTNYQRYNKTILTTWTMSFNKISKNDDCGVFAIEVLNIMAYISPDYIDVEEVFRRLNESGLLWDAVSLLGKYSVINIDDQWRTGT